jgi:hypothetical protein
MYFVMNMQWNSNTYIFIIIKNSCQHNKSQLKTTLLLHTLLVSTVQVVIIRCIFLRLKRIKYKTKIAKNNVQSSQNIKHVESVGDTLSTLAHLTVIPSNILIYQKRPLKLKNLHVITHHIYLSVRNEAIVQQSSPEDPHFLHVLYFEMITLFLAILVLCFICSNLRNIHPMMTA